MEKQIISLVVRCIKTLLRKFVFRCFSQKTDQTTSPGQQPNTIRLRENTETFKGVYTTFEKVSNRTNYDLPKSLDEGEKRLLKHELWTRTCPMALMPADPRCQINNLIALLIAVKQTAGRLTILDYGGGMGETFFKVTQSTSTSNLDYVIYEKPDTRDASRRIFETFSSYPIKYIDHISRYSICPDIIYLGSVLQYIPDYTSAIVELCALDSEVIMLTDQWITKSSTFVTSQINERDRIIPMWIFQFDEIVNHFHQAGYRLISRTSNYQPWVRTGKLSEGISISDSENFLFCRGVDKPNTFP